MPDMCCPGCQALPYPIDSWGCLFCLTPDSDEEELKALEGQVGLPDEQFAEYLGSILSCEPVVLSEFDEEAFEAYEKRQEAISLFLSAY